jgi:hypothetical protein
MPAVQEAPPLKPEGRPDPGEEPPATSFPPSGSSKELAVKVEQPIQLADSAQDMLPSRSAYGGIVEEGLEIILPFTVAASISHSWSRSADGIWSLRGILVSPHLEPMCKGRVSLMCDR